MKITKQYLKGLIKEALQQEMGVGLQKVSGYDRGGGAEGYEDVDSDKWSKDLGKSVIGSDTGTRLMGYAKNKDSDGLLKSLKGSIGRVISGTAAGKGTSMVHGDYAVANLNVNAFVEGLISGAMERARNPRPGAKSLLKVLQNNKEKLVSILKREKSKTLELYPDAAKNPGSLKHVEIPGTDRGMGNQWGYETVGSEREDEV